MPRFLGRGGTRKVSVPTLSGLTRAGAINALQTRGLQYLESILITNDSSLANFIHSHSFSSGAVLIVGTPIPFVYYEYQPPTCVPTSYSEWTYNSISWSGNCVSSIESGTSTSRTEQIIVERFIQNLELIL